MSNTHAIDTHVHLVHQFVRLPDSNRRRGSRLIPCAGHGHLLRRSANRKRACTLRQLVQMPWLGHHSAPPDRGMASRGADGRTKAVRLVRPRRLVRDVTEFFRKQSDALARRVPPDGQTGSAGLSANLRDSTTGKRPEFGVRFLRRIYWVPAAIEGAGSSGGHPSVIIEYYG